MYSDAKQVTDHLFSKKAGIKKKKKSGIKKTW